MRGLYLGLLSSWALSNPWCYILMSRSCVDLKHPWVCIAGCAGGAGGKGGQGCAKATCCCDEGHSLQGCGLRRCGSGGCAAAAEVRSAQTSRSACGGSCTQSGHVDERRRRDPAGCAHRCGKEEAAGKACKASPDVRLSGPSWLSKPCTQYK